MKLWLPIIFSSLIVLSACGGNNNSQKCTEKTCDTDGDGIIDTLDEFVNDKTKAASVMSAHRLLNQATFGATEDEIDKIVSIGTVAWVEEELNKPSAYDKKADDFKTHLERTKEIAYKVEPSISWVHDGIFGTSYAPIWHLRIYQFSAWWENALGHPKNKKQGSDQLRQRVAYSLSQLLVASLEHSRLYLRGDSLAYYNDILAKHAFGNFRDLLGEVSRSATMGVYLSYQGNEKAEPSKSTRPDENFAREIIQLFTVGLYELNIDGSANRDGNSETYPDTGTHQVATYTQKDIVELSKVMTGWDVKRNPKFGGTNMYFSEYAAQMEFFPEHHEDEQAEGGDGLVTVLGTTFPLNSGSDGSGMDAALDVLFNHPNTGTFVSKHLIVNLVTSNPSPAYIARVTRIFNNDGKGQRGNLKAVIRAILTDSEARNLGSKNPNFGKVKEPFLAFTQLLRAFKVEPINDWKGPADNDFGDGSQAIVKGVYSYGFPQEGFGQGPLRSKSVFNFYMPDHTPRDDHFVNKKLISPVSQIQTDGQIMGVHNLLAYYLEGYEKNRITKINKKTLVEFAQDRTIYSEFGMIINYDRELSIFETALEGDSNGDFKNITNLAAKEKAVNELLKHLDKIMLGSLMDDEFKKLLADYLLKPPISNLSSNYDMAYQIVADAVHFIAISPAYMVQK